MNQILLRLIEQSKGYRYSPQWLIGSLRLDARRRASSASVFRIDKIPSIARHPLVVGKVETPKTVSIFGAERQQTTQLSSSPHRFPGTWMLSFRK